MSLNLSSIIEDLSDHRQMEPQSTHKNSVKLSVLTITYQQYINQKQRQRCAISEATFIWVKLLDTINIPYISSYLTLYKNRQLVYSYINLHRTVHFEHNNDFVLACYHPLHITES